LVKAQSSEASSPELLSVTAENNTVEFIVNLPEQNKKCQVGRVSFKTRMAMCAKLSSICRLRSTR